jgi:hypothetical protein
VQQQIPFEDDRKKSKGNSKRKFPAGMTKVNVQQVDWLHGV